jgi:hypothetical protein
VTQRAFALIGAAGILAACHPAQRPQQASNLEQIVAEPAASPTESTGATEATGTADPGAESAKQSYSAFGSYAALPDWSGWCGLQPDGVPCAAPLAQAVKVQSPRSRPTVRAHGWHLWASLWAPIAADGARNDAQAQRTSLYGTQGCWSQLEDGTPACGGIYPIWLTWPNTGKPYGVAGALEAPASGSGPASTAPPARAAQTLRTKRHSYSTAQVKGDPNPTRTQTVHTNAPSYALPPLVLSKQCGMTPERAKTWLAQKHYQQIVDACAEAGAPGVFCPPLAGQAPAICDGTAFVNQGDVMIATESLSVEGYDDIQRNALYDQQVLEKMYAEKTNTVSEKIGRSFISTKHMFWPVKGCRPGAVVGYAGCRVRYGALPPWVPKDFKQVSYSTNADYLGYEQWQSVVAIDTCQSTSAEAACPPSGSATLALDHVSGARPISTKNPKVYSVDDFLHLQVSGEALEDYFTATDRALLDQATIWAYGDQSGGFEPGDFLVVVAMHLNTKEVPSWAFQSVWWSPMSDTLAECPLADFNHCFGQTAAYAASAAPGSMEPNVYSGLTQAELISIDAHVGTGWRSHYLMTDSYGINYELDGTPVKAASYFKGTPPAWATTGPSGEPLALLPVSANVYIEPVIHPLGTECQNCHRRAGYPGKSCTSGEYSAGCGRANYQTAQCGDLLADYGSPERDACLTTPWAWHGRSGNDCKPTDGTLCAGKEAFPVLATDWIWLIADGHVQKR